MTSFQLFLRVPLKTTLSRGGKTFRIEHNGTAFRVYLNSETPLTLVGTGDIDVRTPMPRWSICLVGCKAEPLPNAGKEQAIATVCDRWLATQEVQGVDC